MQRNLLPLPWNAAADAAVAIAVAAAAMLGAAGTACAASVPLDDEALSRVGGGGVAISVDLSLNTAARAGNGEARLVMGFGNQGGKTYAIVQNFGGNLLMNAFTFHAMSRLDGSDYLDIGLPATVIANDFGFRALAVGNSADAPVTKANSYGELQLNGAFSLQGHVLLWSK